MQQINARQMAELKAILAKVGLDVKRKPQPKGNLAKVKAWKPQTTAGRACKSAMLYWASFPPIEGVKDYQARGSDGQWYSDWMDGFSRAVEYQKLCQEYADLIKYGPEA